MQHMRAKLMIGGLILLAAVGYLALTGVASGWVYYLSVDELLADADYTDQRVRLAGVASESGFDARPGELVANFRLLGETRELPVAYRGAVPPAFAAGIEVIVEGKLDDQGLFHADVLLTKCASKYESEGSTQQMEAEHAQFRR